MVKKLIKVFLVFMLLVTTSVRSLSVSASSDALQLAVNSNSELVEAGDNAVFTLTLTHAITNKEDILENAVLTLDPQGVDIQELEQIDLNEIKILNSVPTLVNNKIVYRLGKIDKAFNEVITIKIPTRNGVSDDETSYSINATFTATNLADSIKTSATPIKVNSTGVIEISTTYINVEESPTQVAAPGVGETSLWEFNINAPKISSGIKYFEENSKIIVNYHIEGEGTYDGVFDDTVAPSKISEDKKSLTWEFEVPTIEEQEHYIDSLFNESFIIKIKINNDAEPFKTLKTIATLDAKFIGDVKMHKAHEASVMITQRLGTEPPLLNGQVWPAYFYGPKDDVGGISTELKDVNPTLYNDSIIGWRILHGVGHAMNPWPQNNPNKMQLSIEFDGNQSLYQFYSSKASFRPGKELPTELREQPKYAFKVEYTDGEVETIVDDVQPDTHYKFGTNAINLKKEIKRAIFDYSYIPSANYNPGVYIWTKPNPGYIGEVALKPSFSINGNGNGVGLGNVNFTYDENGVWDNDKNDWYTQDESYVRIMGKRSANIVEHEVNELRIFSQDIKVNDDNMMVVGDNTVEINLINSQKAIAPITGEVETYVVLPSQTKYLESLQNDYKFEIVDENYQNTDRQLVKIMLGNQTLSVGKNITIKFKIEALKTLQKNNRFEINTYLGEAGLINLPDYNTETNLYPTIETDDINDLNQNDVFDEIVYLSVKNFQSIGNYGIAISTDSGFLSTNGMNLVEAKPGDTVEYQIALDESSDSRLDNVKIMGILPVVNDYGLVTLNERNSKIQLGIQESIKLDESLSELFDVYYSEEQFIEIKDELDKETNYPVDFKTLANHENAQDPQWKSEFEIESWDKVRSFKIIQRPNTTVNREYVNFRIPIIVEQTINHDLRNENSPANNRSGWMNIALTANDYIPIENLKSGIYVNEESIQPDIKYGKVLVRHVDEFNEDIVEPIQLTGEVGQAYQTESLNDELYKIIETPINSQGVFKEEVEVVIYKYMNTPLTQNNENEEIVNQIIDNENDNGVLPSAGVGNEELGLFILITGGLVFIISKLNNKNKENQ